MLKVHIAFSITCAVEGFYPKNSAGYTITSFNDFGLCLVKLNLSCFISFCLGELTCSNCNGCLYSGYCADYDPSGNLGPPSKEDCTRHGHTAC